VPRRPVSLLRERDVQGQILDWLNLKKIFCYRQNTGGMVKGRHFVRFAVKGSPDIIAVIKGQYVGIEVKRPGEKQSPEQAAFETALVMAGGKYLLARSLEDVMRGVR
jgi:hypothetical protein